MKLQEKPQNNEVDTTGVTEGKLCNECCNNVSCKDKLCPLYKFRGEKPCDT